MSEPFKHKNCPRARGIKEFECLLCGKKSTNYSNGIIVCKECCVKRNVCEICGRDMVIENERD